MSWPARRSGVERERLGSNPTQAECTDQSGAFILIRDVAPIRVAGTGVRIVHLKDRIVSKRDVKMTVCARDLSREGIEKVLGASLIGDHKVQRVGERVLGCTGVHAPLTLIVRNIANEIAVAGSGLCPLGVIVGAYRYQFHGFKGCSPD